MHVLLWCGFWSKPALIMQSEQTEYTNNNLRLVVILILIHYKNHMIQSTHVFEVLRWSGVCKCYFGFINTVSMSQVALTCAHSYMPCSIFIPLCKDLFITLVAQPNIHSQYPTPMNAAHHRILKKGNEPKEEEEKNYPNAPNKC